jgi:hypothetical protein
VDIVYVLLLVGLFGLTFALIPAFARLQEQRQNHREEPRK